MKAVTLPHYVHAGCGGKVLERQYPELQQAKLDRINLMFANGTITEQQADKLRLAAGNQSMRDRSLECQLCGEATASYGSSENPQHDQIDLQYVGPSTA